MTALASPDPLCETAIVSPIEITEPGPSRAARLVAEAAHMTVYAALDVASHVLAMPLPYGMIERAARLLPAPRGVRCSAVELPHAHAELVCARSVSRRSGRAVLYCHGGAFLCGGISTHLRIIERLSAYADAPVLAVNYRMLPKHTIDMALDDCHDAFRWLRGKGYRPEQIAVAGDSAGGYLALALTQRLCHNGERPAALALLSPLLQLAGERPRAHGPMLPHHAFAALTALIDAHDGLLYEPLEHITADLPPTLIHVSGSEELLHDARLAAEKLAEVEVPAEVRVWPGQIHVFQLAAGLVPEATRSLRQIGDFVRATASRAGEPGVAA